MAMRSFAISMAADTTAHNLYTLMLAQTGAIPTDGILADRGNFLMISPDSTNAGTVTVQDAAGDGGKVLTATSPDFKIENTFNTICYRDFFIKGSQNSQKFQVTINGR